jgi:hypothetical protein
VLRTDALPVGDLAVARNAGAAYFCDADNAGERGVLREWDTIRGQTDRARFPQSFGPLWIADPVGASPGPNGLDERPMGPDDGTEGTAVE